MGWNLHVDLAIEPRGEGEVTTFMLAIETIVLWIHLGYSLFS